MKDAKITLALSLGEKEQWQKRARAKKKSMSDFVRDTVNAQFETLVIQRLNRDIYHVFRTGDTASVYDVLQLKVIYKIRWAAREEFKKAVEEKHHPFTVKSIFSV